MSPTSRHGGHIQPAKVGPEYSLSVPKTHPRAEGELWLGRLGNLPCFLDFEASGLGPASYPIEVAWSLENALVEAHLIRPMEDWTEEGWDWNAQYMHQMARDQLFRDGKEPAWLCERMNDQLAGKTVYCDSYPFDRMWLNTLFDYGEMLRSFQLADIQLLLKQLLPGQDMIDQLKIEARSRVPGRHRAEPDVRYLIELYRDAAKKIIGR